MKLEDQVCSLELAKKLEELKIPQESWCYWVNNIRDDENAKGSFIDLWNGGYKPTNMPCWSAFTVAELLDLLPRIIDTKKNEPFNNYRFRMEKFFGLTDLENAKFEINYLMNYFCDTAEFHELISRPLARAIYDTNPANACAKMLIFLKENELV